MTPGDLAMLAWCDLGAVLRTRPVPLDRLDARRRHGLGYATAGAAITPLDGLVDNPWGPMDEMRLVPVDDACAIVPARDAHPAMHLHLTHALSPDGVPCNWCPRNFCDAALAALEAETGWTIWSAYEHEFTIIDSPIRFGAVYSVEALRAIAPFAYEATAALRPLDLECFEPEFGHGQFEVSCAPVPGTAGADRAVLTREVLREIARRHGLRATFSPKPTPEAVGSGMHVHFSFRDRAGRPALYDRAAPATVTPKAAGFIAGVLRHIDALSAICAPSPVSYLRLGPGHWSCGYGAFGVQNREAALRVCPSPDRSPEGAAEATNLELRVPDGTCNPYLALGALALAGLAGMRDNLPLPPIVDGDPAKMPEADRRRRGIEALPSTLSAALDALEGDALARSWMPLPLHATFVAIKRSEVLTYADATAAALTRAYSQRY